MKRQCYHFMFIVGGLILLLIVAACEGPPGPPGPPGTPAAQALAAVNSDGTLLRGVNVASVIASSLPGFVVKPLNKRLAPCHGRTQELLVWRFQIAITCPTLDHQQASTVPRESFARIQGNFAAQFEKLGLIELHEQRIARLPVQDSPDNPVLVVCGGCGGHRQFRG